VYSGHTGVDPYTTAVSDTYQDLFSEGIFAGKGLYDVDAFVAALEGRVPENALLSHDLFEGLHARPALVTDVEVVDDYPASVLTHARRQHRWARGDWQILFWLFPLVPTRQGLERNTLPLISRWKIFDNLRRTLVAPGTLLALVAGWLVLPGRPWVWTAAIVASLAFPLYPHLVRLLVGRDPQQPLRVFLRIVREDVQTAAAQVLLLITFLAYHAYEMVHAIALTLMRLLFTQRRLLEWETAAAAAARAAGLSARSDILLFIGEMAASPLIALVVLVIVAGARPAALPVAAPILALWFLAPIIAAWLSRPVQPARQRLDEEDGCCCAWWPERRGATSRPSWGPPTTACRPTISRRSPPRRSRTVRRRPTSRWDCFPRSPHTTSDISALVRCSRSSRRSWGRWRGWSATRGTLLNWYDTSTLAPLTPRYVSTVDSGNLAGALIAMADGLQHLVTRPQTASVTCSGLLDTAEVALRAMAGLSRARGASPSDRALLVAVLTAVRNTLGAADRRRRPARARPLLRPELSEAIDVFSTDEPPEPDRLEVEYWSRTLAAGLEDSSIPAGAEKRLGALAGRALAFVDEMNFRFLHDRQRQIFAIGYRLADAEGPGRLDPSFYDLLASEARLASFVAIAKGDVPDSHWFHLGRLLTSVDGASTLLSWSATLFEYLMPQLVMKSYPRPCWRSHASVRCVGRSSTAGSAESHGAFPNRASTRWTGTATISTRRSACRASGSSADWATNWWWPPTRARSPRWWTRRAPRRTSVGSPAKARRGRTGSLRPWTTPIAGPP
jgi:hypothetical protein